MLEKDQVKAVLKNPRTNIYYAVNFVKKYILQKEVMILVIGSMVEQIQLHNKKSAPTSQQLYNYFYNSLSTTINGTHFGRTDYTSKTFLKNVWNDAVVQAQIIGYFRENGYKKPQLSEEEQAARDARIKERETLKSAAKARKAKKLKKCRSCNYENCTNRIAEFEKEFEKIQKTVPVCFKAKKVAPNTDEKSAEVAPNTDEKSAESAPKYKGKELNAQQKAYIETLKNL